MNNELLRYRPRATSEAIEEARKADAKLYFAKYSNELIERVCPVCGSASRVQVEPYAGSFGVAKCNRCLTLYVNPGPTKVLLDDYYQNALSVRLLSAFYAERDQQTSHVSDRRIQKALESMCARNRQPLTILEIGCNEGRFIEQLLHQAKSKGLNVSAWGIEPSIAASQKAIHRGLAAKSFFVGEEPISAHFNTKFDYVFCFELLEHLLAPFELLREVQEILKPGGELHMTTPNSWGLENILTGYNGYRHLAHAIAPPAHLNAFNIQNITHLGIRSGLYLRALEATGKFDAYALHEYLNHGRRDIQLEEIDELTVVAPSTLQELINALNASSTMHVVMSNG